MRPIREIFRDYAVFDSEGRHVNGTDKESNHHYGDAYEKIIRDAFGNFGLGRESVKLMMEIGVADGSSILAWREVFPNATIVGMDIHHSDKAHGERIEFHLGNAGWKLDCDRVVAGRKFDLIVEDATHHLTETLLTLLYMWPHVRPGGMYVVEEWSAIAELRDNVTALWPFATVVDTVGPFGGIEPLVVFRKPV
jgi:hypothetical protein